MVDPPHHAEVKGPPRMNNEITTRDMTPETTFAAAAAGPVLADITCPDGTVTVTVDPAATVARIRVFTEDGPDSPAADAARGARILACLLLGCVRQNTVRCVMQNRVTQRAFIKKFCAVYASTSSQRIMV